MIYETILTREVKSQSYKVKSSKSDRCIPVSDATVLIIHLCVEHVLQVELFYCRKLNLQTVSKHSLQLENFHKRHYIKDINTEKIEYIKEEEKRNYIK